MTWMLTALMVAKTLVPVSRPISSADRVVTSATRGKPQSISRRQSGPLKAIQEIILSHEFSYLAVPRGGEYLPGHAGLDKQLAAQLNLD